MTNREISSKIPVKERTVRLGVDRTYVSRVAKGERHSPEIEAALVQEFDRSQQKGTG